MGVGAKLKEAREQKNISLDTLQETTKIQKRYLMAIEEERFNVLPGKFYARAFIKEYAVAVGLDPIQLMEEYKDDIPLPEEEHATQYTRIQRSRKQNNPTKSNAIFSVIPTIIVVILIIGIVFAVWFFLKQSAEDDKQNAVLPEEGNDQIIYDADEPKKDSKPEVEEEESDNPENDDEGANDDVNAPEIKLIQEGTGTVPESIFELEHTSDKLIVTFEAKGDSWLEVKNGVGKSYFNNNFSTSDSPMELDLSEADKIFFNVGNAPNLKIDINGTELEYPIDANQRVHQKIWINVLQKEIE